MKFELSKREIVGAFGSKSSDYFQEFNQKLSSELEAKIHPTAELENLRLNSTWKDTGGNIHASLKGEIKFLGQCGEVGGEFVWLNNIKKFRGKAWSSLEIASDGRLLEDARRALRLRRYTEARDILDAISNFEFVPRSARFLKKLIAKKLR
ncbi:MAG: hypothetical protein ABI791_10230 [Acidobacteriota bacterium]